MKTPSTLCRRYDTRLRSFDLSLVITRSIAQISKGFPAFFIITLNSFKYVGMVSFLDVLTFLAL